MEGWGKIKPAATDARIKDKGEILPRKKGLPHSRLPSGTILVKFSHIDEFLKSFQVNGDQVDKIVDETMEEFEQGSNG